jgi:hypothetical protein
MSLVQCDECGKQISSEAEKCPNCGYKKPMSCLGCIFFFILILIGIGLIWGYDWLIMIIFGISELLKNL